MIVYANTKRVGSRGVVRLLVLTVCVLSMFVYGAAEASERGGGNPYTTVETVASRPLKFHGGVFAISGYLVELQGQWYLYCDEEAAEYGMLWRSLSVVLTESTSCEARVKRAGGDERVVLDPEDVDGRWVVVLGKLNTREKGERDILVGTIENVGTIIRLNAEKDDGSGSGDGV